jgi:hypothetical protein
MRKIRRSDCVATRVARMNSRLSCEDRHTALGKYLFQGRTRCPQLVVKNGSFVYRQTRIFGELIDLRGGEPKRAHVLHPQLEGQTLEAFTQVELR